MLLKPSSGQRRKGRGKKKSKEGDEMTKAQSSNVLTQPIPRLAGIAKLWMHEKKIVLKK